MAFKGIPAVKQHRLVNEALKREIEGIHGLQVRSWLPRVLFILYVDRSRSSKPFPRHDTHALGFVNAIFISQSPTGTRAPVHPLSDFTHVAQRDYSELLVQDEVGRSPTK